MAGNNRSHCLREKGDECWLCNSSNNIHVHHIDANRANNSIDNLIPVCRGCHTNIHAGNDDYEEWIDKLKTGPTLNRNQLETQAYPTSTDFVRYSISIRETINAYSHSC